MTAQNVKFETMQSGPGLLIRILWFIFVGWWLGLIWVVAAWFFNLTIIGLPLGLAMINSTPQVMTLKPSRVTTVLENRDGTQVIRQRPLEQHPFLLRALYFLVIGFWFSLVWTLLAWLLSLVTLGLAFPLSFWMFNRVPAVTTLARL
ncbi:MAG: YccF domain-containing protein [Anaerolineaceae bacterium]|jgi:uncharacterized membrane protein YccF (DUF307 family)